MPAPTQIHLIGEEVALLWPDGHESFFPMSFLRASSPSAENIGEKDLLGRVHGGQPNADYAGVRVTGYKMVGSYAIQFLFSDGHNTGLFGFDYLQDLAAARQRQEHA